MPRVADEKKVLGAKAAIGAKSGGKIKSKAIEKIITLYMVDDNIDDAIKLLTKLQYKHRDNQGLKEPFEEFYQALTGKDKSLLKAITGKIDDLNMEKKINFHKWAAGKKTNIQSFTGHKGKRAIPSFETEYDDGKKSKTEMLASMLVTDEINEIKTNEEKLAQAIICDVLSGEFDKRHEGEPKHLKFSKGNKEMFDIASDLKSIIKDTNINDNKVNYKAKFEKFMTKKNIALSLLKMCKRNKKLDSRLKSVILLSENKKILECITLGLNQGPDLTDKMINSLNNITNQVLTTTVNPLEFETIPQHIQTLKNEFEQKINDAPEHIKKEDILTQVDNLISAADKQKIDQKEEIQEILDELKKYKGEINKSGIKQELIVTKIGILYNKKLIGPALLHEVQLIKLMFQFVQTMVADQQEGIDKIEKNCHEANELTKLGLKNIAKSLKHQVKNKDLEEKSKIVMEALASVEIAQNSKLAGAICGYITFLHASHHLNETTWKNIKTQKISDLAHFVDHKDIKKALNNLIQGLSTEDQNKMTKDMTLEEACNIIIDKNSIAGEIEASSTNSSLLDLLTSFFKPTEENANGIESTELQDQIAENFIAKEIHPKMMDAAEKVKENLQFAFDSRDELMENNAPTLKPTPDELANAEKSIANEKTILANAEESIANAKTIDDKINELISMHNADNSNPFANAVSTVAAKLKAYQDQLKKSHLICGHPFNMFNFKNNAVDNCINKIYEEGNNIKEIKKILKDTIEPAADRRTTLGTRLFSRYDTGLRKTLDSINDKIDTEVPKAPSHSRQPTASV